MLARALTELRVARARDRPTLRLEERVRRLAAASRAGDPPTTLDVAALLDALGDRALVGFTAHRDRLLVTTAVAGRVRARTLGPVDAVARRVRELRFALSVGRSAPAAAAGLDEALFGQLRADTADRELVVLPDGPLHGLPWSALPSCRGRAVSAAPSAARWLRAAQSPPSGTGHAWIAGPGLAHADRETAVLRAAHGGTLLTGRAATADAVLAAIDGVAVAHLAVHGTHRDDQPPLSALRVADGPLHGYDLARLRRAPGLVVLSACDSGLAPVLLRAGARTVVASPLPVPDDRVVAVMTALHARLRGGASPAAALAAAQEADDLGFTCHGAG
ncbi:CHAT domain-containing protein [Umezawaea beigongshangensis]|uniref:CHAT domain-containing protein n=1 Tax=Umezawaea beigongshangensis TaxID=2780383 RepID=UPI003F684438